VLARRLIACLDVRDGRVVKGVCFDNLRDAGDPAELAERYAHEGIDEIALLDITATLDARPTLIGTVRAVADRVFIPFTVGGGIRSQDDARAVLEAGADKISLNTMALRDPSVITSLAHVYGSQAIVVAIDAKRTDRGSEVDRRKASPIPYEVYSRSGTAAEARDAVDWAREAESRGAGEILLTSIDRDGTRAGFDCELTARVSSAVDIPVIASGGAGAPQHFADVFSRGYADAALAASVFHFSTLGIRALKDFLADRGVPMRLDW